MDEKIQKFITSYIKQYGNDIMFFEATEELNIEGILFENQYPFLNSFAMKKEELLKDLFYYFGYYGDDLHVLSTNTNIGYMSAIFCFGDNVETINDVENRIRGYYKDFK